MFRIRDSFAAGKFYSDDPSSLKSQIGSAFNHKLGPKGVKLHKIIAGIVPHSTIDLSGPVASWVYSRTGKSNFIILGASHRPLRQQFAIIKEGFWRTPLGETFVDSKMAKKITDICKLVEYDTLPHENEHSIEVQLPFLQYRFGSDFMFVPIMIHNQFADEDFLKNCTVVGQAIADAIRLSREDWIIIATSEFPYNKKTDAKMLKSIMKLDGKKFFDLIKESSANVCGFGAVATVLAASKKLRAKKSRLLKYASAVDLGSAPGLTGAYASIIIY